MKAAERNAAKGRGKSKKSRTVPVPKTPLKAAPATQAAPSLVPEEEGSPGGENINVLITIDVRQMQTAKLPPVTPSTSAAATAKAPLKAKVCVRPMKGATAHAAAHGPRN